MGVMQATPRLDQSASRSPPHERIRGKREGICLPDAGPKEKPLYKVATVRGGLEDHAEDVAMGGAGSWAAGHLICNQTPAYIRGSEP
jgi:hypothetical protein